MNSIYIRLGNPSPRQRVVVHPPAGLSLEDLRAYATNRGIKIDDLAARGDSEAQAIYNRCVETLGDVPWTGGEVDTQVRFSDDTVRMMTSSDQAEARVGMKHALEELGNVWHECASARPSWISGNHPRLVMLAAAQLDVEDIRNFNEEVNGAPPVGREVL